MQGPLSFSFSSRAQFVQALVLSTMANLDAFRVDEGQVASVPDADHETVDGNNAPEQVPVTQDRRSPSSQHHQNNCNNNAVNKKDDRKDGDIGITHTSNVPSSETRQAGPPPVKPKPPPTATKPVPHSLPNYERGAGRGGPSAGSGGPGGMVGKVRSHQQQPPSSGGNANPGTGSGAGGNTDSR